MTNPLEVSVEAVEEKQQHQETGEARKADGDWWLDVDVMLSRAVRLSDLLRLRVPGLDFLLQGPPKDLSQRLKAFCRQSCHVSRRRP